MKNRLLAAKNPSLARAQAAAGVFLLGLLWVACSSGDKTPVATVNGEVITAAKLKRQVRVFQSVRPGSQDDDETRRQVLDQVVKQRLLVQAARRAGLDKDAKNLGLIKDRREALRIELEKNIADAQAQLQGLDEAVEARTLIEAFSQAKRTGMTVTEKDLQAAYKARLATSPLPPFSQVRDQMLEQVILDRLVEEARQGAKIEVSLDKLR